MKTIAIFLLCLVVVPAIADDKLTLPHYDWGACPFECCTYREWRTSKSVIAREKPSDSSKSLFTVPADRPVTGITGVVITTKPGITRILKSIKLGYDSEGKGPLLALEPGERLYTLHYLGEGYDLFWYKGRIYSDQFNVSEAGFGDVPFSDTVKVESRPEMSWWVKIKDSKGRVGWSKEEKNFDRMDACG